LTEINRRRSRDRYIDAAESGMTLRPRRGPQTGGDMATRRTTMRSRTGTKLYAVRDESGKFKDIQTYKRAHTADMRHKSKAEIEAARGPIEKKVRKAAKTAVKSVKRSLRGAVAAVERAAQRAVKKVAGRQPPKPAVATKAPGTTTAGKATLKSAGRTAVKKSPGKPAAKKVAKRVAKVR
jgi:hypothetical protein